MDYETKYEWDFNSSRDRVEVADDNNRGRNYHDHYYTNYPNASVFLAKCSYPGEKVYAGRTIYAQGVERSPRPVGEILRIIEECETPIGQRRVAIYQSLSGRTTEAWVIVD